MSIKAITVRKNIQAILGVEIDGDFGPQTTHAFHAAASDVVASVQKELCVLSDGKRGPFTVHAFEQLADLPDEMEWPPFAKVATASVVPVSHALAGPLNREARTRTFGGPFEWRRRPEPGNPENIEILGDWEEQNIVTVEVPQLRRVPGNFSRMRWSKRAVPQLLALWAAWEKAGLLPLVLSYEGSFVPRLIRGSTSSLSNHAYGSAFDINYHWNQLGREPAPHGAKGSVVDLVPLAHEHGFYWGGHFERRDGMHFEVCVIQG